MSAPTISERWLERRNLLKRIEAHPERPWTRERKRVAELQRSLAFHETARP